MKQTNKHHGMVVGSSPAWKSLQWKASVWVHLVVCHSTFYIETYRNLYIFSSIPTERRHSVFKLDLRHCYLGYSMSRPHLSQRGLKHVVNMHALDLGLCLHNLTSDAAKQSSGHKRRRVAR